MKVKFLENYSGGIKKGDIVTSSPDMCLIWINLGIAKIVNEKSNL